MTKIQFGEDSVRKLAELARLDVTNEEVQRFASQISNVLSYIEKLNALDTTNVEPLVNPETITEMKLREDAVISGPGADAMLASAPEQIYENFKVPQVIGGGS